MQAKLVGIFSLICLVFTILWLVFLIVGVAAIGPLNTFDQTLDYAGKADMFFYMTYINAAIVTITAVMLFTALYIYCKPIAPAWSAIGIIFVPMYGSINMVVYLSQVTVVPRLFQFLALPEYQAFSQFFLRQVIQLWPGSIIFIINNLAYAILGMPSIIFGLLMLRSTMVLRLGGIMLVLNGFACITGFIGIVVQNAWLSQGSLIGGILFLLALVPMSLVLFQRKSQAG